MDENEKQILLKIMHEIGKINNVDLHKAAYELHVSNVAPDALKCIEDSRIKLLALWEAMSKLINRNY